MHDKFTGDRGALIAPSWIKDYTGGLVSRTRGYELLRAGVLRGKKLEHFHERWR